MRTITANGKANVRALGGMFQAIRRAIDNERADRIIARMLSGATFSDAFYAQRVKIPETLKRWREWYDKPEYRRIIQSPSIIHTFKR